MQTFSHNNLTLSSKFSDLIQEMLQLYFENIFTLKMLQLYSENIQETMNWLKNILHFLNISTKTLTCKNAV